MKKTYIIGLIFICFLSCLKAQESVQDFQEGIAAIKKNDFEKAVLCFKKVIDEEPTNYQALLYHGIACLKSGDFSNAKLSFEAANKYKKNIASYQLAQVYAMQGNSIKAVENLKVHLNSRYKLPENEIRLNPGFEIIQNDELWIDLWKEDWYSKREKTIEEIKYLNKYQKYFDALDLADNQIKRYKKSHELYAARAEAYNGLNNYKGEIVNYTKAIKLNKRNSSYYLKRGRAYLLLEKYNNALSDFDKVLKLTDDNIGLYLDKAEVLNGLGKYKLAIKNVELYMQLLPDDIEALLLGGEIYFNNMQYEEATSLFGRALELDPSRSETYLSRGNVYYMSKKYGSAFNDFSMALDLDPKNPMLYLNRGNARLRMGQYKGACLDWEYAEKMGSREAQKKRIDFCK